MSVVRVFVGGRGVDVYQTGAHRLFKQFSEPIGQKFFRTSCKNLSYSVKAGLAQQVSAALFKRQQALLNAAIRTDLNFLAPILRVTLNRNETQQLGEALKTHDGVEQFLAAIAGKKEPVRNDNEANRYYLSTILTFGQGVNSFLQRHPKARELLELTAKFFGRALHRCLQRIDEDRSILERVFFDSSSIVSLQDILFTASDSHKQGAQVLILTFGCLDAKGQALKKRIVYKPSDIEIDYRLAGRNTPELLAVLDEKRSDRTFPAPHPSLFELLDDLVFKGVNEVQSSELARGDAEAKRRFVEQFSLPTYRILPRNPGSRLAETGGRIPIEDGYGYMEYLSHNPLLPVERVDGLDAAAKPVLESYVANQRRWKFDDGASEPDWIVEKKEEAIPFFRLWGRLAVIACVALQTDLHQENERVRNRKPHILDLENCLVKACPLPFDTMIPQGFRRLVVGPGFLTRNQLFMRELQGRKVRGVWLSPDDARYADQVKAGVREALQGIAANRPQIEKWIQDVDLANVVVRHVVVKTADFYDELGQFRNAYLDPANWNRGHQEIVADIMSTRREASISRWQDESRRSSYYRNDNPYPALDSAAWNGEEYGNVDVPVYYRRAGSRDLLSWWGDIVTYDHQPGDPETLAFTHYHSTTGLDLLKAGMLEKLPPNEAELRRIVSTFVGSMYKTAPDDLRRALGL